MRPLLLFLALITLVFAQEDAEEQQQQPQEPDLGHIVPFCVSLQIKPEVGKVKCREAGVTTQPKVASSRAVYTCVSDVDPNAKFVLAHDDTKAAWTVVGEHGPNNQQAIVAGVYSYAVTPELIKRVSPRAQPLHEGSQQKGFEVSQCEDAVNALPNKASSRNARTFFMELIRTREDEAIPLFLGSFYSLVSLMKNPVAAKPTAKFCKGFGANGDDIPVYFGHTSLMYVWCLEFIPEGATDNSPVTRWYFSGAAADIGTENCLGFCHGNWILDTEFPTGCQFMQENGANEWTEFGGVRTSWSTFETEDDVFVRVLRWRADDWVERSHPNTKALKLSNELEIPLIGLGTGGLDEKQVKSSLAAAFKAGYVLIDTASEYGTEAAVGDAVTALPNGARGAIIMTKVWPVDLGFERTTNAVMNSRNELKVSTIDSVLLHWPKCYAEWNVEWMDCKDASPDTDPLNPLWRESWKALEKLYAEGIVLSIGVSNFDFDLLSEAVTKADAVAPQIVQNQFSLKNLDEDVVDYCRSNGILYMSYAMLREGIDANERTALKKMIRDRFKDESPEKQDELIKNERYVLMRWAIENNVAVIPRSKNAVHVKKNIDVTLTIDWVASSNPETEDILDYPRYEQADEL